MIRTFRYPLKNLTSEQEARLEEILLGCQRLYNAALNVVALGWSAVSRVTSKEVTLAEAS
jgi:hypothetical protein